MLNPTLETRVQSTPEGFNHQDYLHKKTADLEVRWCGVQDAPHRTTVGDSTS
ncbi:hypothetical protein A2U01_0092340 [Trifolium medium]|uniref:Uncharacterized protein n=1 Tax=Trifolium medium TaxID=97028 RepID=A0A392UE00_9FABA|nr:hypothetical protein [Trifolium medium]